ncbi:hypothetical protein BDP55DRAFT_752426 [Colletotrichum godetiae]|uniref:TAM domain methyltransferase n=1 Tax=Colletotrichum godetiae TaxID=1209918 RepID=A0AAJ0AH24_9PEZI|nr:uncharacterized protein BDP55DRAFT_752426 [Colletotrichum godetiae]KAK1671566.1 hypothetical protein BDP55DRAFT_752426 [Colletotrichum godetiae]
MPADTNDLEPHGEPDGELDPRPSCDSSGSFSSSLSSANDLDGTESLISNLRASNFENKRRYHKYEAGRYMLPNDDIEQDREELKYALIVNLCDGANIMLLYTGTGIWAMEIPLPVALTCLLQVGDDYPEAEIISLDLSPIQPVYVPPDVHFTVDDVEADWLHAPNSIDCVHPTSSQGFCHKRTDINIARDFAGHLESAGFTNQIHDMRKVPVGTWPKFPDLSAIGDYCRAVNYDLIEAITNLPFARGFGWSRPRVEVFLIEVRKDLLNNSFHPYHFYHSYLLRPKAFTASFIMQCANPASYIADCGGQPTIESKSTIV